MEPISSLQAEEARLRSKLANNPFFSSASNFFQFLRWMLIMSSSTHSFPKNCSRKYYLCKDITQTKNIRKGSEQ